jgi:hypothetical protein
MAQQDSLKSSTTQQITLRGKHFYEGAERFYPMAIHYAIWPKIKNGNYFLASDGSYSTIQQYECESLSICSEQMRAHFNYIAGMGFNTVRSGFHPTYIPNIGLVMSFNDYTSGAIVHLPLNPFDSADPGMQTVMSLYNQVLAAAHDA